MISCGASVGNEIFSPSVAITFFPAGFPGLFFPRYVFEAFSAFSLLNFLCDLCASVVKNAFE
jgi:hypothetical protein